MVEVILVKLPGGQAGQLGHESDFPVGQFLPQFQFLVQLFAVLVALLPPPLGRRRRRQGGHLLLDVFPLLVAHIAATLTQDLSGAEPHVQFICG